MVDQDVTAKCRSSGREENPIVGCKAAHVISFHPDGRTQKWANVKSFMEDTECEQIVDEIGEVEDELMEDMTWVDSVDYDDKFSVIEKDSFVAIKAHSSTMEQFHVYKVVEKKRAEERIQDSSGDHWILKGEPYIVGRWYSYQSEGRKHAQYVESKSTEPASIHVGEVFFTDIELDEKNRMDIQTYRMLLCSV